MKHTFSVCYGKSRSLLSLRQFSGQCPSSPCSEGRRLPTKLNAHPILPGKICITLVITGDHKPINYSNTTSEHLRRV